MTEECGMWKVESGMAEAAEPLFKCGMWSVECGIAEAALRLDFLKRLIEHKYKQELSDSEIIHYSLFTIHSSLSERSERLIKSCCSNL